MRLKRNIFHYLKTQIMRHKKQIKCHNDALCAKKQMMRYRVNYAIFDAIA